MWHNFHNLHFYTQLLASILHNFRLPYQIRLWFSFFTHWCRWHVTLLSKHYTQFSGLHTLLTWNLKAFLYNTQIVKSLHFQFWWAIWHCDPLPHCFPNTGSGPILWISWNYFKTFEKSIHKKSNKCMHYCKKKLFSPSDFMRKSKKNLKNSIN